MSIVDDYKSARGITFVRSENFAKPYRPRPTKENYSQGYIVRYFARIASDFSSPITEIDKKQFESHEVPGRGLDHRIYRVISLRWKISGTKEEIQISNFNMLEELDKTFPGIKKKLKNVLEFWNFSLPQA